VEDPPPGMSHQTHIERLAGRESATRARARKDPLIGEEDDAGPVVTAARVVEGAGGAWTAGSVVAGRFVLQQRLGRGRYGPIYKALDRSLSEALIGVEHHVALHELHPRIATQSTLVDRLEQLPLHPQSWSHPNIVKLLDFGRDGAGFFLCEEFLEGASLRLVLDESAPEPLAYQEVLGTLRSVGDALNYAHAKGIVHGDIRPENVFVTSGYTVKVLGLLPGTEPRLSPFFVEDAESGGQPHVSDDVYGLACLAYELLTGRHPYNGNSPIEALGAGIAAHPVPNLPPLRWQALSRGLALRRERRTASVPELLAGLGVTGTETLHPPAVELAQPPPAVQPVPVPQSAAWPQIRDPEEDPRASRTARAAAPAQAAHTQSGWSEEPLFARGAIDSAPQTWVLRQPPSRRSSPARTVLGLALLLALAVPAVLVYRDHARLRVQAADLIETGAAVASEEIAKWQARSAPPQPSAADTRAVPPAAQDRPAAAPAVVTIEPVAPAPAESTADNAANQAVVADPVPPNTQEATVATAAPSPTVTSLAAAPAGPARFTFAERTVTVGEGETSARIVIRRTGSLAEEASVAWWAADRSALADEDYAVLGARIERFAPGEESRAVHIPLIADSVPEQRETFVVNLRSEGTGSAAQVEVVVLDDDS
jgi:serine/threonine protein kinase